MQELIAKLLGWDSVPGMNLATAGKKITGPHCRCLINVIYLRNYSEGRWSVSSPGFTLSDSRSWGCSPYCLDVLHPQPLCYNGANRMKRGQFNKYCKSKLLKSTWCLVVCLLRASEFKSIWNLMKVKLFWEETLKWSKQPPPLLLFDF